MVQSTQELPPSKSVGWSNAKYSGRGHLTSSSEELNGLAFLHVPPTASQKPVEGWDIPPFPFDILSCAVYPLGNVLAVAGQVGK